MPESWTINALGRMRDHKSRAPAGDAVTLFLPATRGPVIAPISTLTSLPWARTVGIPVRFAILAQKSPRGQKRRHNRRLPLLGGILRRRALDSGRYQRKYGNIENWPTITSLATIRRIVSELTKGRDLIVDPSPASGPINFLVYPLCLIIDGKTVKPETSFAFRLYVYVKSRAGVR